MKLFLERCIAMCAALLVIDALCFSIASILTNDENRQRVVNYGVGIGVLIVIFIMIFGIFSLIIFDRSED